jgi:ATP-dependent Lon protease
MNSNNPSNDDNSDIPGVLTRAQRKKLLKSVNDIDNLDTDLDTDYDEINTEDEEDDEIDEVKQSIDDKNIQDRNVYEYTENINNNEDNMDLNGVVIDFVSKFLAHSIAQKINQNGLDIDYDDDEYEYDDEENIDDNGYYTGDGFVVPDDYNSEDDEDYDPVKNESNRNKTLDRGLSTEYETDNEMDEVVPIKKSSLKKRSPMLELSLFKKPVLPHYKLNKEEADTCQQYFDIMKSYDKTTTESYFMKLGLDDKKKVIQQEKHVCGHLVNDTPLRFKILNSSLPDYVKAMAISKVNVIDNDRSGSDSYKLKEWLDGLMKIPFGKFANMPVSLFSPPYEIRNFVNQSSTILDKAIYGQNETKTHVIQIISQLISNPESIGNVFSIYGPMGTGKTSLVKKGIAEALGRPFTLISLGGMTDSSFFRGHSYTYEGSRPGRIIEILAESQCMNPIIYFDELDKVSDTPKGEEIIHTLIHLTDKSQNTNFHDNYYSGVPIDISKMIFIFSYNDESKINPILRDRMYKIGVSGFKVDEKIKIAKDYLLKSIYDNFNFNHNSLYFADDVIRYIINLHTKDNNDKVEQGVRNLERCLETIVSKLNVLRLTQKNNININDSFSVFPTQETGLYNPNQSIETKDIDIDDEDLRLDIEKIHEPNTSDHVSFNIPNLVFPLIITTQIVDMFLKAKEQSTYINSMYT